MNAPIDIAKTKATLTEKLRELKARAEGIEDDLRQPADDDWEEHATEASADEVLEEVGDVTVEEIKQIERALSRIEAGTYGICARCGDAIPAARMEALPHATKCVTCS